MAARPEIAGDTEWVTAHIRKVIEEHDPAADSPILLTHLAREYPDLFFRVAEQALAADREWPGRRVAVEVLLRHDSLFEWLTNPTRASVESATGLFRHLLAADPSLDFRFARTLPGRNNSNPAAAFTCVRAARAIEILDRTSPGPRLLPLIGHLPNHADPEIAAKAALFVGKRVDNPAWVEKQLLRENPRQRANALEAFWGTKSNAAIRILEYCASDENPRVAGNALMGLHMAGCGEVRGRVVELSRSQKPGHRSAAAWVMGKIGSREFIERLTVLMRDADRLVRSTAVRSLAEIGRIESHRMQAENAEAALREAEEILAELNAEGGSEPEEIGAQSGNLRQVTELNIPLPGFVRAGFHTTPDS